MDLAMGLLGQPHTTVSLTFSVTPVTLAVNYGPCHGPPQPFLMMDIDPTYLGDTPTPAIDLTFWVKALTHFVNHGVAKWSLWKPPRLSVEGISPIHTPFRPVYTSTLTLYTVYCTLDITHSMSLVTSLMLSVPGIPPIDTPLGLVNILALSLYLDFLRLLQNIVFGHPPLPYTGPQPKLSGQAC